MKTIIDLPVKLTGNCEIVDAKGRVLCPTMFYRSDSAHLKKQREIGSEIVAAINRVNEPVNVKSGKVVKVEEW